MTTKPPQVQVLPAEVSRRIAAGEVIEKPASVIRELLDNSLDAGARTIDVSWDAGGTREMRVHDDGHGMSRDDLSLCWKPHATSKIRTIEDLEKTRTLGFRGEALSSIAAVSELTIESSGNRLHVREARMLSLEPAPPRPGTIVVVQDLFANLPARRRFLSRAQAEGTAIRSMVLEKALPVPHVRFTLTGSGGSQEVLPVQSAAQRVAGVYGNSVPAQVLTELEGSGEGFSCRILAAHPEIIRRDRRLIQIFVNGRRVREYRMVQAVEYAYQDVQHGGVFPVAAVLLEVDPEQVDFNIHPAKQEVRLRNGAEIHHRIVRTVRDYLRAYAVRAATWHSVDLPERPDHWLSAPPSSTRPPGTKDSSMYRDPNPVGATSSGSTGTRESPSFQYQRRATPEIRFMGTAFGTFNIVEYQDRLYIIDQHAAHERLRYNRLQEDRIPQPLLVPQEFEVTPDQDSRLQEHLQEYTRLGVILERLQDDLWQLKAIPAAYSQQIGSVIETVLELGGLEEQLDRTFLARIACTGAVKAGDYLDELSGLELARKVLELPEPRCPHGRPLWVELDRAELEKLIGRR